MTRKRWIQVDGELIPADEYMSYDPKAPMVMPDIQPYQSMIDGSMITSRSHHRAHLKAHGMVEVGNDSSVKNPQYKPPGAPPGLKQTLIDVANSRLREI